MLHEFKTHSEFIGVLIPEGARPYLVSYPRAGNYIMDGNAKELNAWKIKLPTGKWELVIANCSHASEEEAERVVEKECVSDKDGTDCYYLNYRGNNYVCRTALESLSTLLLRERMYAVMPYESPCKPRYRGDCEDSCQGSWAIIKRIN